MPIPKPKDNESQDEFIARCMGDELMNSEYPDNSQRAAICNSQWRGKSMDKSWEEFFVEGIQKTKQTKEERKAISVELKEDKEGSFVARIATLNVRDKDNDITIPGAFPQGKTVLVSAYMHGSWQGKLPIGKAVITEFGNDVIAEGQFNLNMAEGRETYEAVKFAPDLQEWSYGFYPTEAEPGKGEDEGARILKKVDVKEISPVLIGAGVNTGVLAIKSTYADQAEAVLATVKELVARSESLADLRLKEGRTLSTANRKRLADLLKALNTVAEDIKGLLDATEPVDVNKMAQAQFLYMKIKMMLDG